MNYGNYSALVSAVFVMQIT